MLGVNHIVGQVYFLTLRMPPKSVKPPGKPRSRKNFLLELARTPPDGAFSRCNSWPLSPVLPLRPATAAIFGPALQLQIQMELFCFA